jgi:hypothetical protein
MAQLVQTTTHMQRAAPQNERTVILMYFVTLLKQDGEAIVAEAAQALDRSHLEHYEGIGRQEAKERLRVLFELTLTCLERMNAEPMRRYAETVAHERYTSGFELFEVQTAFNVLEEAIWKKFLTELEPSEFGHAIGLISTILGIGKDTLARAYVSLATRAKVPSLDLRALFAGATG